MGVCKSSKIVEPQVPKLSFKEDPRLREVILCSLGHGFNWGDIEYCVKKLGWKLEFIKFKKYNFSCITIKGNIIIIREKNCQFYLTLPGYRHKPMSPIDLFRLSRIIQIREILNIVYRETPLCDDTIDIVVRYVY
jgi:hypothetical protein